MLVLMIRSPMIRRTVFLGDGVVGGVNSANVKCGDVRRISLIGHWQCHWSFDLRSGVLKFFTILLRLGRGPQVLICQSAC